METKKEVAEKRVSFETTGARAQRVGSAEETRKWRAPHKQSTSRFPPFTVRTLQEVSCFPSYEGRSIRINTPAHDCRVLRYPGSGRLRSHWEGLMLVGQSHTRKLPKVGPNVFVATGIGQIEDRF